MTTPDKKESAPVESPESASDKEKLEAYLGVRGPIARDFGIALQVSSDHSSISPDIKDAFITDTSLFCAKIEGKMQDAMHDGHPYNATDVIETERSKREESLLGVWLRRVLQDINARIDKEFPGFRINPLKINAYLLSKRADQLKEIQTRVFKLDRTGY